MVTQKELLQALGGERSGAGIVCAGPNHSKHDRSLSVTPANNKNGFVVHSFAGDDDLECLDFVRAKLGLGEWTPTERTRTKPLTTPNPKLVKRAERVCDYIYHTADGQPYLRVTRMSDKSFRQSHYDDIDGWVSGKPKGSPVPYNLPSIIERAEDIIYLVEGEKDADTLTALGFLATTASGGGKSFPTDIEFLRWFDGREVVAIPDNDDVGSAWAERVRDGIADVTFVRVPVGKDVTDYVESGATADDIRALSEYVHESETEEPKRARFRIRPLEPIDPTKIPPREWLLDNHLIRKFISVTAAPGGMGKSSMVLVEALAMAANRPLFEGMELPEKRKLKVYVWMGEDPLEESHRRLAAAMIHYKVTYEEIKDTLFIDSGRDMPIKLARMVRGEIDVDEEFFIEMTAALKADGFDAVILDPFVQLHSVSENDNGAIDTVAKRLAQVADEANCAIEIVAHVRKQGQGNKDQVTMDDLRGAGSLKDAVRSGRVLNFMPEEVAEAAGVVKEDRLRHFSVKGGKANLSPNTGNAQWRKMVGVPLGNGNDKRDQDHVGVCTKYDLPECAQEMTQIGDIEDAILMKLRHSDEFRHWRSAQPPKEWVGYPVIEYVQGDTMDKALRGRVQKIILDLIRADRIHIREGQDGRANTVAYLAYGPKTVVDPYDDYAPPPHDDQPF